MVPRNNSSVEITLFLVSQPGWDLHPCSKKMLRGNPVRMCIYSMSFHSAVSSSYPSTSCRQGVPQPVLVGPFSSKQAANLVIEEVKWLNVNKLSLVSLSDDLKAFQNRP